MLGFLQLTNDGRFPAALSEVITPQMDYLPFLAEGTGLRWRQSTGAAVAPNVVTVQTPPNAFRLVYGVSLDVLATAAIAKWKATVVYGIAGVSAPIIDFNQSGLAAGERYGATFWFPNPLLAPPSSDFSHIATVGAAIAAVNLSVLAVEFPA